MDLGRDCPVLCLHCHQSFRSRSICNAETSRTSFELLVSFFLRGAERFQMSERFSVGLPTVCRHPHHSRSFFVSSHSCRKPFSQCGPSIFRHAGVFGQTVEQALAVRDHSGGQVLLLPFVRQNSSPNHYLAPSSIRQPALLLRSRLGTKLLACILPNQEHLDMHWLRPQNIDRMARFEALLFQVMKDSGMASVFSRSS